MSTNHPSKKIMAIIGLLFLLPALYIEGMWLRVYNANPDMNAASRADLFRSHFPSFLGANSNILIASIIFALIAIVLSAKSFKQPGIILRLATVFTVIIGSLIIVLDIFQLL